MRKNIIVHKFSIYRVHSTCQGARSFTPCHASPHLFYLNPYEYPRDRYLYFPKDADEEIGIKKFSN